MRTTVTLDNNLVSKARDLSGIQETSSLIKRALETFVETEAARRLARLGGSCPNLKPVPRRQSAPVNGSR